MATLRKTKKCFFKTDYRLMQVKSIAECSKGSILQYFGPSLSYQLSLRPLCLSIFECPFYTGCTVLVFNLCFGCSRCLIEMVLLRTHIIYFGRLIRKIIYNSAIVSRSLPYLILLLSAPPGIISQSQEKPEDQSLCKGMSDCCLGDWITLNVGGKLFTTSR